MTGFLLIGKKNNFNNEFKLKSITTIIDVARLKIEKVSIEKPYEQRHLYVIVVHSMEKENSHETDLDEVLTYVQYPCEFRRL